jgi:hypothetical protein
MSKARKYKKIESRLAGHPIREINWRDNMLELLFLGALAQQEGPSALEVFQSLRLSAEKLSGKPFDGSVRAWNEVAGIVGDAVSRLVKSAPAFFSGATLAMFRRLPLEGREQVLATTEEVDPGIESDFFLIAGLLRQMWDGHGPLGTKAKALHLWALLGPDESDSPNGRIRDEIKRLLDGSIPNGETTIRASWLGFMEMSDFAPSAEFAIKFWEFGFTTPCLSSSDERPSKRPWPVEGLVPINSEINALIAAVLARCGPAFDSFVRDVLVGLLGRLRSLLSLVLSSCERGEGEAAEIFLRCLADTNITIRWMLMQDDLTVFLKYKQHSSEKEKHAIDTLRSVVGEDASEEVKRSVDREYSKLHRTSGRWPELMDVTLGPWNDVSIGKMAKDLGGDDERKYTLVFGRASDAVHGSWRSLTRFHLEECLNPLHNGHYLPTDGAARSAGVAPAVVALMLTFEALLSILEKVLPPEAEERAGTERAFRELLKWSDQHFDPSAGIWRVDD